MSRVLWLFVLFLSPALVFAEPTTAPVAPSDGPTDGEVVITGDEADDSPAANPSDQPAGPLVDSKVYESWSKFGVGTTVESKGTITAPDQNGQMQTFSMDTVSTLQEKGPDSVKIQTKFTAPPNSEPIPDEITNEKAKVPQGMEYAPEGFRGTVKEIGTENITFDNQTYECRVLEFDGFSEDTMPVKGKVWVNDDVPGTHVKLTFELDFGGQKVVFERILTKTTAK